MNVRARETSVVGPEFRRFARSGLARLPRCVIAARNGSVAHGDVFDGFLVGKLALDVGFPDAVAVGAQLVVAGGLELELGVKFNVAAGAGKIAARGKRWSVPTRRR